VEGPNQTLLRSYSLLCPGWVRWSLKVLGVVVFLFTASVRLREILPPAVEDLIAQVVPHLMYLIACWGFLSMAAFYWAILRTQQRTRLPA
jgi:hypothetical protein